MLVTIRCPACNGDFRIPENLFVSRFAGRETSIRCKKCNERIVVDGTRFANGQVAARRRSVPPPAGGVRRTSNPPPRRSTPPTHFEPALRGRVSERRSSVPPAATRIVPTGKNG